MTEQKSDRRVAKSKKALVAALVELLVEKGYEETNVADVCERADVGRSTFYAHFADKEDLFRESLRGLRAYLESPLVERAEAVHPALAFGLPMLQHVAESKELLRSLVSRRSAALDLVHEMLVDLVDDILKAETGTPQSFVAHHIVGSFLSLCSFWMNTAPELVPREVDRKFRLLVEPGLAPLLRV